MAQLTIKDSTRSPEATHQAIDDNFDELYAGDYVPTVVNATTYDLLTADKLLHVTYTATGAVTSLTLKTDQVVAGRSVIIKDAGGNSATNNITIDTEGSETIDGEDTLVLSSNYSAVNLYSDGTNWFIT